MTLYRVRIDQENPSCLKNENELFGLYFQSGGTDTMLALTARLMFKKDGTFIPEISQTCSQLEKAISEWANDLLERLKTN